MALNYLIFDRSEADDGTGSFDTMASATAAGWPALQAEVVQVLAWAHAHAFAQAADGPGALEDGCEWDCELRATQERSSSQTLRFDPDSGRLLAQGSDGPEWLRHTITLCLSGTPAFCAAFAERFLIGVPGDDG